MEQQTECQDVFLFSVWAQKVKHCTGTAGGESWKKMTRDVCCQGNGFSVESHSIPPSRSWIKILNRSGPRTELWEMLLVISPQLTPFTTTLWSWPSRWFSTQRSVHPSKPWAASVSRLRIWRSIKSTIPLDWPNPPFILLLLQRVAACAQSHLD